MSSRNRHVHTVYDVMDAKGVFDANPANAQAHDPQTHQSRYAGPVEFPTMLYHPEGKHRVVMPERVEQTSWGPERRPAVTEMITRVVQTQPELDALLAKGWHQHPADAMAAAGLEAPPKSSANRIAQLEAEIKKLTAEKTKAGKLARVEDEDE